MFISSDFWWIKNIAKINPRMTSESILLLILHLVNEKKHLDSCSKFALLAIRLRSKQRLSIKAFI